MCTVAKGMRFVTTDGTRVKVKRMVTSGEGRVWVQFTVLGQKRKKNDRVTEFPLSAFLCMVERLIR